MDLKEALWNSHEKIVEKWADYMLSTYESSKFFKKEKDQFANPIGGTIRESLTKLFLLLSKEEGDTKDYTSALEQLMKLRSVQEFSPSQAIAPLNAVKHITREVLDQDTETKHLTTELYDFEFAVDLSVLAAFDLYMQSREILYNVRINEIKSGRQILTDSKCPSAALKDIKQENIVTVKSN